METIEDTVTGVSHAEMEKVVDWYASGRAAKRATINRKMTSYGIKHIIERDMGVYISNESCIAALKSLGFTAKHVKETPNYMFNIHIFKEV